MANWNKEDIELVKKFIEIKNRGLYADGTQLTEVYNRVLGTNAKPTGCGSCIRQRVNQLEDELKRFEAICKAQEASKSENDKDVQEDKNKVLEQPQKKVGRPRKNV